jgi:hypothetical protein
MRRNMRVIAVLLVIGALGLGASAAFGTTGSSSAGSLSFTVSLPDTVASGQSLAWSASVSNGSQVSAVDATITFNLSGPGVNKTAPPLYAHFTPGMSFTRSGSFRIPAKAQAGLYTVTMTVNSGNSGSGSTSATTTLG